MSDSKQVGSEGVTRSLRRRSLVVIGLLAALAVCGLLLFWLQALTLETGVGVVNTSGRQRMISQRSALLAQRLALESDPAARQAVRQELEALADELETAHVGLIEGNAELGLPKAEDAAVLEVYHEEPHRLDRGTRDFVTSLREVIAADALAPGDPRISMVVEAAAPDRLLGGLNAAVSAFQAQEERKLTWLRQAQFGILLLTLAALEIMRRRIINPIVARVGRHLDELELREQNIHREQEKLRLILENAPQGIATCDMEGRILNVNQALSAMLQSDEDGLVGRSLLELTHPDDTAVATSWLHKAAAGEVDAYKLDQRLVLQNGHVLRGVFQGVVIKPEGDHSAVLIAQFEDQTERLAAQEALRMNHERMAHFSRLSTMGEMAAGIAHEINQPLSAIILYADASRRLVEAGRVGTEKHSEALLKIGDQAHRAGEVIRRIRSLSSQKEVEYRKQDLNDLVRETLDLAGTYVGFHDFRLKVEYGEDLPLVSVDQVQIQQVILNLINNAVEAQLQEKTDDAIQVTTRAVDDLSLEVEVTDAGGGLPDGLEDHLFEPFFSTKEGGMGMGLSISRSIVDNHGGSLGFRPRLDLGGTSFFFRLPLEPPT